jgi:hypothetical protein
MIKRTILGIILLTFLVCPCAKADQQISVNRVKEAIVRQSLELGIDPALALSIAKHESKFLHETKSKHGAVGVFQLMPSTARKLGVNPYYMEENIKGGLTYYKKLYQMFGSTELALAAYNAGPGNVKKYNKVPPYSETKKFITRIMTEYNYQKKYPDPIIAKVKNINIKKPAMVMPKKLPDTTRPLILEDPFIAPTEPKLFSEQNLI